MCGISIIIRKDKSVVCKDDIAKMNKKIIHRGPDGEGIYIYNNVGLGHRRLSIVDLSFLGHQPMHYLEKYIITYNGEIYNYLEIRDELVSHGYIFNSSTDTEVILAAFDFWKEKCVEKFNGMWAFGILNKSENKLFLSRDRFGVKPLYYKETENDFILGSEIKQLLNEGENEVNLDILLESILTHVDNHTNATYFKNIFSFPSSHYMWYDLSNNTKILKKFYQLKINKNIKTLPEDILVDKFNKLFNDSIKLRMRSDVKVGSCLSGGLDSSSISAIASNNYNLNNKNTFNAITAKSIDNSNDESFYAQLVADLNNIELNIVTPSYENFLQNIDEVIYTQEEPFGSPSMFMGWNVFKKAKEIGCIVMLNGQGGDEILLGYERYFSSTLNFLNPFVFFKQLVLQYKNSRLSFIDTFLYYLYFKIPYFRIYRLKSKTLLKKAFIKKKYFEIIKKSSQSFSNSDSLQLFEITSLQLPHLLRYEDRNSMRHSIETRLPFLDYRLVEFAVSLPVSLKIKNGWTKYILRKSIENLLPEKIVWRKNKFGFEAPDKIWLNNYSTEMLNDIKSSKLLNYLCDFNTLTEKYNNMSLKDKWMYFNIARWEKVYKVILPKN
jgi:asparagine synthase (glutamine-hydrolysing)